MATVKEHVKSFEVCDITGTRRDVRKVTITMQVQGESAATLQATKAMGASARQRALALLGKAVTPTPRNAEKIKAMVNGE